MPLGFSGPDPSAADVWLPLQIAAPASRGDEWGRTLGGFSLTPFVRLAPGVTPEAADAAATAAVRGARADSPFPEDVHDREATALLGPLLRTRGPSDIAGDLRLPLVVGGVALVVLLVAAANVTNLLMLRVTARRRELAVRNALGAGRWGVGRLLVIESVLLAALSGAAALAVAAVAGRLLRVTLLPRYNWAGGPVDVPVMAFTGVTVLVVGLAAALAPALYATRTPGLDRLDGLRGARAGSPVRNGLIVVQSALSIVLLVGGALFLRSFEAARRVDIGYAKENLLTVTLGGGMRSFIDGEPLDENAVLAMESRVSAIPGVVQVAQATSTPLSSRVAMPVRVDGLDTLPRGEGPYVNFVSPGFFRVAGLAIRDGRGFVEGDRAGARRVAVVSTVFARQAWPGGPAIGRCLFVGEDAADCAMVVGVVETPLERGLRAERIRQYYLPLAQAVSDAATSGMAASQRTLVVRTDGDPERIVRPVLLALAAVFPDLSRSSVQSLSAALAPQLRTWRIGSALFGAAALLALLLAAVGLYAVVAFGVRQRELEFGIRRALGAQSWHLLRLVMARGVGLVATGVAAGSLAALWPAGSLRRCSSRGAARAIRWPSRPPPWCCSRWPWPRLLSRRAGPRWPIPAKPCRRNRSTSGAEPPTAPYPASAQAQPAGRPRRPAPVALDLSRRRGQDPEPWQRPLAAANWSGGAPAVESEPAGDFAGWGARGQRRRRQGRGGGGRRGSIRADFEVKGSGAITSRFLRKPPETLGFSCLGKLTERPLIGPTPLTAAGGTGRSRIHSMHEVFAAQ